MSIAVRWVCAHRYGSQLMIVFNTFAQFDTLLSGVLLALVPGLGPRPAPVDPLAALAPVAALRWSSAG